MSSIATKPNASLVIRKTLNADRETVFQAWTDPNQVQRWFSPTEQYNVVVLALELITGGSYRFAMQLEEKGIQHTVTGVYKEIIPNEKLVFTWQWEEQDMPDGETLVTIELHPAGNATELVLTHERFSDQETCDKHDEGWSGCLNRLETTLS